MGKVTDPSLLSQLDGSSSGKVSDPSILAALEGRKSFLQKAKDVITEGIKASSAESDMMSRPENLKATASLATGSVNWIPPGIIKAAGVVSGQLHKIDPRYATQEQADVLANKVQGYLSPTLTPEEQKVVEPVSKVFTYAPEKLGEVADTTFESMNKSKSPYIRANAPIVATAIKLAGEAAPFVIPGAVGKGVKIGRESLDFRGLVKESLRDIGKEIQSKELVRKQIGIPVEEIKADVSLEEPIARSETIVTPEPVKEAANGPETTQTEGVLETPETPVAEMNGIKIPEVATEASGEAVLTPKTHDNITDVIEQIEQPPVEVAGKSEVVAKNAQPEVSVSQSPKSEPQADLSITGETQKAELPLGGETNESRLAVRAEADAIEKNLTDNFGNLAEYKTMNMKEQAASAQALMDSDYERAKRVAMGDEQPPEGLRPASVYEAVKIRALLEGDVDTLRNLATESKVPSALSAYGQEIKAADSRSTEDPVVAMQDVSKVREERVKKTTGKTVDSIKQEAEIASLKEKLDQAQKALDEHIRKGEEKRYGTRNKLITRERYEAAKKALAASLKDQFNVGIDPENIARLGEIGLYHLEAGTREFAAWSERMVKDLGDWVKPHLQEVWDSSTKTYESSKGPKKELTEDQKIKAAIKSVNRSIIEYERRLRENDTSPRTKKQGVTSPELEELKQKRDELRKEYQALPEVKDRTSLKGMKSRLKARAEELQAKLNNMDLGPNERRTVPLDEEARRLKNEYEHAKEAYNAALDLRTTITPEEAKAIVDLSREVAQKKAAMEQGGDRIKYGAAKVAFDNYVDSLKGHDAPVSTVIKNRFKEFKVEAKENAPKAVLNLTLDAIKTISDNSISMVATFDNSFLGRQGLHTLFTHPSSWWVGAKNSFLDIGKTLGGQRTMDALLADIYSRENYLNGNYKTAKILAKSEEQFPSTLPERIPGIGRVFKASEVAFRGSGLRMRTDLFDMLVKKASENGVDMTNPENLRSYGKLINALTARGQWGKRGEPAVVRLVLWAPKMLKGNIDVLTAHVGQDMTLPARKEAAMNLLKIVGTTATIMAVANAIKPGSAELDPRSTNFGKIRVGDTRFDITGGAASLITLASRLISNSTKSATTGIVKKFGTKFGDTTRFDTLIDFLSGKTTPPVSFLVSQMKGKDRLGKEATMVRSLYSSTTPISLQNFINLKDNASADRVAGAIIDVFGISSSSYSASEADWSSNMTRELENFRKKVGETKFKAANDKYNTRYNKWFESVVTRPGYEVLPDEEKQKILNRERELIKKRVLREYGFHYREKKGHLDRSLLQ